MNNQVALYPRGGGGGGGEGNFHIGKGEGGGGGGGGGAEYFLISKWNVPLIGVVFSQLD